MEKQWYVVKVFVGFERRAKAMLERKIKAAGKEHLFGEIAVPTERVIDLVGGKRRTVEQRLFPGYLFVQMTLDEETQALVRSVPKVLGFLGESGRPVVVPERDVRGVMERVEATALAPRPKMAFFIGEKVRVVDGPFRDFTGTVEAVQSNRSRVRVALSVFGRPTPVDLDFVQVEAA
ncbi:MAG TPA: transcription termination/antitermination protein NusG [candidate division Zixibacteria bacterium]|nr:transcription termination/antitermination protein NusG [candidate division Zixibacteria bacterium]